MKNINPFNLSGFADRAHFCDREDELALLRENVENGRNTVLFSWRRMGKTSLVRYFLSELNRSKAAETLYVDLLATRNIEEAIKAITQATYEKFGKTKQGFTQSFRRLIGRLGAEVGFDPLTGLPSVGFSLQKAPEPESSLTAIGEFLSEKKKPVIIAIDEFQQISHYADEKGEAVFRAWMQGFPKIRFIFSGSHRGVMTSMFTSENRPFYRSAELMSLTAIEPEKYLTFIRNHFLKAGKKITDEVIHSVFEWSLGQTYAIQLICNKLFGKYDKIGAEELNAVLHEILDQESSFFSQYANLLTKTQWNVLRAIANGGKVQNPLSADFIRSRGLTAASSVSTALGMLRDKEIVVKDEKDYRVHDVIFMRWMQRL